MTDIPKGSLLPASRFFRSEAQQAQAMHLGIASTDTSSSITTSNTTGCPTPSPTRNWSGARRWPGPPRHQPGGVARPPVPQCREPQAVMEPLGIPLRGWSYRWATIATSVWPMR